MNYALAALAFASSAQQPSLTPAEAASQAAVEAFTEACVQGEFRLSPDRGRFLRKDEQTELTDVLTTSNMTRRDVVKLNYPPETYLIFAQWRHSQLHSIASECVLLSRSITKHDAMAALMATTPGVRPMSGGFVFPSWTIDQPKRGYRSRMYILEGGTIVLNVGMYGNAREQSGAKQH